VDPVSIAGLARLDGLGSAAPKAPAAAGFADVLKQALDSVNSVQSESDRVAGEFQLGNPDISVEQVMIALNRANVAFQAAVQVRNRLVAAYSEVMNMQV
jgi:flagellar hook-basal body complex protein FliE